MVDLENPVVSADSLDQDKPTNNMRIYRTPWALPAHHSVKDLYAFQRATGGMETKDAYIRFRSLASFQEDQCMDASSSKNSFPQPVYTLKKTVGMAFRNSETMDIARLSGYRESLLETDENSDADPKRDDG